MGCKARLNTRQVELLRRIVEGVEPVTSREHTLAITVYALRSRGLVTTRRADGIWVAAATDTGRYYAEHGTYPEPARAAKPAHVVRTTTQDTGPALDISGLIAQVEAAGGTLTLKDPDAATRAAWRAVIQRAIQAGHRLHHTGRLHGDLVVSLQPVAPGPATTPRSPGRVARRTPIGPLPRTRTHPLIAELRTLSERNADATQSDARPDPRLPPVSRAAIPRTLRILQLLFTQAERRGHVVRAVTRTDRRRTHGFCVTVHGHEYPITIVEYGDTLTLKLDGMFGGRRAWGDGLRVRLEHRIPDVLASLEARAREAEQRRREREQLAQEHSSLEQAEAAHCRAAYAQDYITGVLREQAATWRLADEIRAICARIQWRIADGTAPSSNQVWLAWALQHAEQLDPTTKPLTVPQIPEPAPQDLIRYLAPDATPASEACP